MPQIIVAFFRFITHKININNKIIKIISYFQSFHLYLSAKVEQI